MESAFGILIVNVPLLIFSALIAGLGAWLFQASGASLLKSIAGAFLFAVGGLALLSSLYFQGFRWVNGLLGIVFVIWVGLKLIQNSPGAITSAVGAIVIVLGVLSLSQTEPMNQINIGSRPLAAFNTGFQELLDVLGIRDSTLNRDNGGGENGNKNKQNSKAP